MKKLLLLTVAAVMFSASANAGEYLPYMGIDYVNMSPNVSAKYPDNYNAGSLTAGVKFADIGSVEFFAERAMKEKESVGDSVSRGRLYGFGVDGILNAYNMSQGAILASVGYGRISAKLKHNGKMVKDDGNDLRLGVGGELNPSENWGFRSMFRYSLTDSKAYKNAKEFSIGVRYYFY